MSASFLSSFKCSHGCRKGTGLGCQADIRFNSCMVTSEPLQPSDRTSLSKAQFQRFALSKSQSRCSINVYFSPLPSSFPSLPTNSVSTLPTLPPSCFLSGPQLLPPEKGSEMLTPSAKPDQLGVGLARAKCVGKLHSGIPGSSHRVGEGRRPSLLPLLMEPTFHPRVIEPLPWHLLYGAGLRM